jgi:hypothetical protein
MDDEEFDARGITVAGVETRGMEHRGAGVLLAETKVGRESERIEPTQLLEIGKLEAGVTVELHALSFDRRRELKVFR